MSRVFAFLALTLVAQGFEGTRFERDRMGEERLSASRMGFVEQRNNPSFDAGFGTGGYDQLSPSLTINGITVAPKIRCLGENATVSVWTCTGTDAEAIPIVNAGADVTASAIIPTRDTADKAVDFTGAADYYRSAGTVNGQVSTGDIVIEWVGTFDDNTTVITGTRAGANVGYEFNQLSSNILRLTIQDSGGSTTCDSTGLAAVDGAAYHVMVFVNRDEASTNGCMWYVNSAELGGTDVSSRSGTLTNDNFTIGARNGGSLATAEKTAYLSIWESTSWHQAGAAGPTEWAAIAKERMAYLQGVWPDVHHGTGVPNVQARASTKTVFKGGELHVLGAGWLSTIGGAYSAEGAITNKLINTDEFSSWTQLDIGDTVDTTGNGDPYGTDLGDGNIADTTDGIHGFSMVSGATTAATWTVTCWSKPGTNVWTRLQDTTVSGSCYFDLDTPAVGTCSGITSSFLTECDGSNCQAGWYRYGFSDTMTAAAQTIVVSSAFTDGDDTFAGDGAAINTTFAGCQLELGDHPTSYCPGGGSECVRAADLLQYKMDDGNYGDGDGAIGTMEVVYTLANFDAQAASAYFAIMTDGGDGSNNLLMRMQNTDDRLRLQTSKSGGNPGSVVGTTDLADGSAHTLRVTWTTDELIAYLDGSQEGSTDSSIDPAVGQDELDVGVANIDTFSLNGTIDRVRVWTTVEVP